MDNTLMMSVQIAIIGIVVVVGLFVLWRRIARLEEQMEQLHGDAQRFGMGAAAPASPRGAAQGAGVFMNADADAAADDAAAAEADAEADAEALMAAIFNMPLDLNHSVGIVEAPGIIVEDAPVEEHEAREAREAHEQEGATALPPPPPAAATDADTESRTLSKSKLRKLSAEALKDMLHERGLSTDGNKNALVDRLHAALVDA